jgi:Lrp/AsnC family transcriptional regulator, leucine-responsive regulatory protein
MEIDQLNRRILSALQRDSRIAIADLAELVGLSPSACHRRVKLLEEGGVIAGYAAHLDRRALGLTMEFFVEVSLNSQSRKAFEAFERAVAGMDEILECHLMAGGTDYLLRVVAADLADFERIHRQHLAELPHISRLQSNLAIRTVRAMTGYPVR